jgi:hypothetical protein
MRGKAELKNQETLWILKGQTKEKTHGVKRKYRLQKRYTLHTPFVPST